MAGYIYIKESAEATRCDSSMVYSESAVPSSESASSAPLVTLSIVDHAPPLPPHLTYEDLALPSPSLEQHDPRVSHLRLTSMSSADIGGSLATRSYLLTPFETPRYCLNDKYGYYLPIFASPNSFFLPQHMRQHLFLRLGYILVALGNGILALTSSRYIIPLVSSPPHLF
ncbi:hypothetical protein B0H13DRAFT_1874442 [Mycena leptocephala]|nr:hypothetical protein B0H13DRAFT_1874442 [Mycena leptocephala]